VSSFAASLLIGRYAPIDLSDASGMNLLDLRPNKPLDWHLPLARLCGSDRLVELLGQPIATGHVLGCISSYFVARHGFSEHCRVVSFTGDNPASLGNHHLFLNVAFVTTR
jgi:xylulokinase